MALTRITSPHAKGSNRTQRVMLLVLLACAPGALALTWLFCEAMDLAMAHRMHLPNPEKRPAQARQA